MRKGGSPGRSGGGDPATGGAASRRPASPSSRTPTTVTRHDRPPVDRSLPLRILSQQSLDEVRGERVPVRSRELYQFDAGPALELIREGVAEGMDRRDRGDRRVEQLGNESDEVPRRELHLSEFVNDDDAAR